MEKVRSNDGTVIAYSRSGIGPPLVLVHGTGAVRRWARLLPRLETRFTVYAVDRRGYGDSGDSSSYAVEREFEDIATVVGSIAEPVNLLGHSFGALCALEAALLTRNLRRLVLYEPAMPVPGVVLYPQGVIDRLQALLDIGDREAVLMTVYRDVGMFPPHEIELLKSSPSWPARLASAHTVPRESRAEDQYRFDPQRFKALRIPAMLLLGGDSPHLLKAVTEAVAGALPASHIAILPGQKHLAMDTAPDMFLDKVFEFLT